MLSNYEGLARKISSIIISEGSDMLYFPKGKKKKKNASKALWDDNKIYSELEWGG